MHPHEVRDIVVNALDRAINEGRWEVSLFFRNVLKRLQEIRNYVMEDLTSPEEEAAETAEQLAAKRVAQGYRKAFVALYLVQGDRIERWVNAIKTVSQYCVSRPVYATEEHISEVIRAKRSSTDGYLSVWVKEEDILSTHGGEDYLGHELLTIREGSVKVENIIDFVHYGRRYRFTDDRLLPIE